jgi:Tol biopolymer transport system component
MVDPEPKAEGIGERNENFWTEGLRLSLGEKTSTQPAICSRSLPLSEAKGSPAPSAYGALDGEIYVVWSDNRVGQRELFMRKSKDGGMTWGEEERLTESKADSISPAVVSDGKQVHLVWEEKSETDSAIFYKRWDGASWSEEQILSEGLPNSQNPDVAVTTNFSGSTIYVVWETVGAALNANSAKLSWPFQTSVVAYLSRSEDGGVTWLKPHPIASPIADAYAIPAWNTSEPKVAGGMEAAYVVWRDERESTGLPSNEVKGQIFIKRWDEVSVGNDIRLSSEGDYRRPDVSVSEQSVYVAWESSSSSFTSFRTIREQFPSVSDIFVIESFDGGQTFSSPIQVTQSEAESTMPRIIAFADDAWLFWQDGRVGTWEIYLARKSSRSENWGQPEQFTKTETDIDSIMPAVTSSLETRFLTENGFFTQIHLLWVERESETRSRIMYSRRDTIPPLPPDKPVHIDTNAQKGYDNDDTLTFYWSHPSVNRLDGAESVHYRKTKSSVSEANIERPAKYNVYFTTLEGETQNAELTTPWPPLSPLIKGGRGVVRRGNKSEIRNPKSEIQLAGTTDKLFYSFKAESGKTYMVAVEAVDEVGNASELSEFSEPIFVDSHPPEVFIHNPGPDTSLFGSTPVIVTCLDDNLVEWRLQYKFTTKAAPEGDEWKLLTSSKESIEHQRVAFWDVSKLKGVYTLELIAVDEAGNQSKVDIPIVVDNTPPIPITSGGPGAKLVISDLDADYYSPAWSPDGSMIAYASNEGGAYDIWVFDLKTHTKNRLTRDTAFDVNPAWSPDSRWLAFQSFNNGNWDIWVISVDGSKRLPILGDVDSEAENFTMETTPAWSPNGGQLAFSSNEDGDGEIWLIMNVDEVLTEDNPLTPFGKGEGKPNLTQLTQNEWEDSSPTWSPDGTKIAFQSNRYGNWDIFCINIDGSQEEQLTSNVANEIKPKWSPDGKRILFISDSFFDQTFSKSLDSEFRSQGEILALEIHSGASAETDALQSAQHADWSPDMKSMVYQAGNAIYLMDFNFPSPQIEAIITRPYEGEYIGFGGLCEGETSCQPLSEFWVDIIGIARGTNFQEYRLEYALIDSASDSQPPTPHNPLPPLLRGIKEDWILIGGVSTSQVPQVGFLGRLDTRGMQGEYILRLSVLSKNGDKAVDNVSVFVEHERPRLVVAEPLDGFITDEPLIVVSGETEANVQVTVNDEQVKLEPTSQTDAGQATSHYSTNLLLKEGENIIMVVARHTEVGPHPRPLSTSGEGRKSEVGSKKIDSTSVLETVVQRRVFLDTQGMVINVDSPKDFEVVNVPYVTVKGSVGQTVKIVKVLGTTVIGPEIQSYVAADSQTSPIKTFQRTILLNEGANLISIEAIDQLNRLTHIQRRVIYEKPTVIRRDINPAAITNILPHDGTVISEAKLEISAILADDVKIASETIALTFDGQEIDNEKLKFNEKDGRFSYIPEESSLDDGEHNFTISVQDTSDNSAQESVKFFIDTEPLEIAISAQADTDDNSRLKVILTSNKPLQSIPLATIIPTDFRLPTSDFQLPRLGYSINLNRVVTDLVDGKAQPFRFEGFFNATPLQNSFTFDATIIDKFDKTYTVHGYYVRGSLSEGGFPPLGGQEGGLISLWGQIKVGTDLSTLEATHSSSETDLSPSPSLHSGSRVNFANILSIPGIVEAIFPTTILESVNSVVLRSQDGLDLDRLVAQHQDAENRGLKLIDIVHVVETDQKREKATFILRLPIPSEFGIRNSEFGIRNKESQNNQLKEKFAFFHWDARLQRWEAMDAIRPDSAETGNFSEEPGWIQAKASEFGAYALLSDETPPTIANLHPKDHQEVPLDRFLVEAEIYDDGSGIDKGRIELLIDDKPAEFTYEPAHNRIIYLPSNLRPGLHTLKLSVQDRASNIQTISSTFFTSDIFDFAEEVIAYPNPAKNAVTIRFKLTKTADVTLKIYSVAGEIIYSEQKNNVTGRIINEWFAWDCKNQAELSVASGVYVYIIEAENSDGQKVRRRGKIAVVK